MIFNQAVDNGENLPPGAMLDLKGMQQAGETFVAVPVSDEEMKRIVAAVPGRLPLKAADAPAAP